MSLAFLSKPIAFKDIGWRHYARHMALAFLALIIGVALRAPYIGFESSDYVYILSKWVLFIREHGLLEAYGHRFHNYAPLYVYMLGLFDALFDGLYPLYSIKYVSFIGEMYAAFWVYRIVALHTTNTPKSLLPVVAVIAVFLSPSVVNNSAITGQCDIWLTGFMLACLFKLMVGKTNQSLIYGGLAFAFKPQAVFFAPMLLVLLLRKELAWKQLWIVPAVYVGLCVPAWLQGRSMLDMMRIYWDQIRGYVASYHAANPYFYFNNSGDELPFVIHTGEIIGALVALLLVAIHFRRWKTALTPVNCLLMATLFASVMPFVLPLMHDRYFFMADVFTLMLACMRPRWFMLPLLFQSASLIALPPSQLPRFDGMLGWVQSNSMPTAIVMNAIAIAMVLWLCNTHLWKKEKA